MGRMIAALALAAALAAPLVAETLAEAGDLVIADGTARAAGPSARTGAGYFTVTNGGAEDDRLVAAASAAAERVELHTHVLENGVARMVELGDGVAIPAGETVALAQGAEHVMFLGLTGTWREGEGVPVTLTFERAGEIEVILPRAEGPPAPGHGAPGGAGHGHGHGPGPGQPRQ